MSQLTYFANYTNQIDPIDICMPDTFYHDVSSPRTSADFVISRTLEGETLSRYGDDVWDLRPYETRVPARILFTCAEGVIKEEAKWLMYLLLYVADSGLATGLMISTIMNYWKIVRKLALHSDKKAIYIRDIFENKDELIRFVSSIGTRVDLATFSIILSHLLNMPTEVSGYHVPGFAKYEVVSKKLNSLPNFGQFPVIPPRIYFNFIQQIDSLISEIYTNKNILFNFLERILETARFGRSDYTQRELGYSSKEFGANFKEASELYNLKDLFEKYGVWNLPSLVVFLHKIQHACKLQIHIYSGMRNGEALSLRVGALRSVKTETGKYYKLIGETSKLVGQKKIVSWVTSKDVVKAYRIVNTSAKLIGKNIGIKENEVPLFISFNYLCITNRHTYYDGFQIKTPHRSHKHNEVFDLLDCDQFRIRESDLDHLEQVNPFRAWEAENAFKLNSVWRFTTHQFRRSLAFYVAQSSHVSLPSLKRQLKHINREMTLYYCHAKTRPDEYCVEGHISSLIHRVKPEADAIAYLHNVLQSSEQLYGAHGKFVEHNIRKSTQGVLLKQSRDNLIKQFKKGAIAYKETPLGVCTTITPCDKKAFRNINACISCDRAVIKLSKLERVIARQSLFVDELKQMDSNSVEYRTEMAELNALSSYREKISPRVDN